MDRRSIVGVLFFEDRKISARDESARREGGMGRVSSYNRAITIKKSRHRLERDHGSVHKEPEVSASSVSLSLSSLSLDLREMLVFVEINKRERERERERGCLRSQKTTLGPSSLLRPLLFHGP